MTDPVQARTRPSHFLSDDGRVVFPRRRSRVRRVARWCVALLCLLAVAGVAAVCVGLTQMDRTPREWVPYLQQRALQHRTLIVDAGDLVARWLIHADRLARLEPPALPASLGAAVERSGATPTGPRRLVGALPDLRAAVAAARPGTVIQLQAGHYHFIGEPILFTQAGTAAAPVTLRAEQLGDVVIESDAVETFKVMAPFWRFENLVMRGVCAEHKGCEHALHIVGGATDTVIRNNRFEDYNAHLKINGENGVWPDRGVIAGNSFADTVPRQTANPVTPIDLVGASFWQISGNIITDFVRGYDGAATYGAYVKGAGEGNVLERNLVICEWKLGHLAGQHVGLSLGGGSTTPEMRRDDGHTGFEQIGGVIRDNLIAFCSDDGVYLNRAARSVIDHNTLLDTAGIDVRFIESSALVTANIVDGAVRGRDGGSLQGWDNAKPVLLGLFLGVHPQRWLYNDPVQLDLRWRDRPAAVADSDQRIDLCGQQRPAQALPGAFENYLACAVPQR